MSAWQGFAVVLVSYWFGGISPATIVAHIRGFDLFRLGSGNPGATNVGRIMGVRFGVVVALLDVAKGALPVLLAQRYFDETAGYVAGIAVVLGHVISPYLKFKGGKGVATTLGVIAAANPLWLIPTIGLFLVGFAVSKKIGLGSVLAGLGLIVTSFVWSVDQEQQFFGLVLSFIVLSRHHRNVRALFLPQN